MIRKVQLGDMGSGVSQHWGPFGGPYTKENKILLSILGSLHLWKLASD